MAAPLATHFPTLSFLFAYAAAATPWPERRALSAGRAAPPVTRFSGHLAHAPAGDTVRLFVGERRAKAALSASGDFQFEFKDLPATIPVHFAYAGQSTRLYLMPGDQLRLTLDFKDFDKTLFYSGRRASVSNCLAQAQWKFEYSPPGDEPRPADQLAKNPRMAPAEMRRNADAFWQRRRACLTEYLKAHPLPAARHDAELAIDLAWGTQLLNYLALSRPQSTAEAGPHQAVDPLYFSFLKQMPLRELAQHMRALDETTAVAQFLYAYQDRLTPSGKLRAGPAEGACRYQLATQELGEGKALEMAMHLRRCWRLDTDPAGAQVFHRAFQVHNRDSTLARDLRLAFAKKQNLCPGKPTPACTLRDKAGKAVSRSDFKGQVVYLDF